MAQASTSLVGLPVSFGAFTLPPMGREHFKTPDEDVAAEFSRVCQLFQLALGKPSDRVLFDSLMSEANARGLNWVQGLEYVINQREHADDELANGGAMGKRGAAIAQIGHQTANDLRKAG